MKTFIDLLLNEEQWLMNRILTYAQQFEFTKYTSTLPEAWRMSINGLTCSLIAAAQHFENQVPELHPDEKYLNDPTSEFGVVEARKHRQRGVTLAMFLGLMKYYKDTYLDAIETFIVEPSQKNFYKAFTIRCFDRIEIAFCVEWSSLSDENLLQELQDSNRGMTNEKNKYLTIFESSYTPSIYIDEQLKIANLNQAASDLFTDFKISGSIYYGGEVSTAHLNEQLVNFVASEHRESNFETYLQTNKGKLLFQVKLKKMLDVSRKFMGTVIMLDDITQQKAIETELKIAKEKAEESDKLKTAFLANMSHEIRTPMNAILGFAKMLSRKEISDEKRKHYVDIINISSNQLMTIIDDIIDISKIEANQIKANNSFVTINNLLFDIYSVFKPKASSNNISLYFNQGLPDKESNLLTDENRLRQILSNLIGNAIKFTHKGYVKFGYSLIEKQIEFYVEDTGIGIAPDKKEVIFERFRQADLSTTKTYGGTGLGLTISKALVHLLGGEIFLESELGKGSIFRFTLPYQPKYSSEEIQRERLPSQTRLINVKVFTILVAEDEEINYLYLEELLIDSNIKLIHAKNGYEAIQLFEQYANQIDLVLMDMKMPQLDGFEASKQIKQINPKVPIIAQTAYAFTDDKERILEVCDDYIAKPIEANHLIDRINTYVNH